MTYVHEIDENGRLLMVLTSAISEELEHYSRYNGGWIRKVEGLDKSKTDGYSILGEFAGSGMTWHEPGLYIDCSIEGSRKNQYRWFTLFILHKDGEIEPVGKSIGMEGHSGGDWAPRMWAEIDRQLEKFKPAIPEDEANEILKEIIFESEPETLIEIKGVSEVLKKHFAGEIRDRWEKQKAAKQTDLQEW